MDSDGVLEAVAERGPFALLHRQNFDYRSSRGDSRSCFCSVPLVVDAGQSVACMSPGSTRNLARSRNQSSIGIVLDLVGVEVEAVDLVLAVVPVEAAVGALENV